ncbi:Integral membrane protein OS=Streptomyces aurantiogriseus OX=66870 GN=GCM10010251_20860 PE=4 SV=1 [Streptomyces aurantiogriseus]|uniref:Uncharacterized protein n=2 Tax=Streptomyces aurantiogriseus TaxID=66870 RepID=A0A918C3C2_9ACTN|nr:hypothetical protein GCM10010251_20860 [Streptomyces aurantiogriseus]
MRFLAWRWILLAIATLGCWAVLPVEAHAVDASKCPTIGEPHKINVTAELSFSRKHTEFVKALQVTTIKVPKQKNEDADDLTLSPDVPSYRRALHCLLLGRNSSQDIDLNTWYPEWPSTVDQPSTEKDAVVVKYESWNLIRSAGMFEVGPWTVKVGTKGWKVTLHPSGALAKSTWQRIEVDPGGLKISDVPDVPEVSIADKDSRVWSGYKPESEKAIYVTMAPPKDLARQGRASWIRSLGVVSWWIAASIVIAASAWPLRRKTDLAYTALQWAGVSAALGLTLLLLLQPSPRVNPWRAFIGISSGFTLVLLARPWLPLKQGSDGHHRGMRNRKAVACVFAGVAAVTGLLVIVSPHLFGLPTNLMPKASPPTSGIVGLALLDFSMLWLWLTAIVAWAWRFAREGKLGEPAGEGRPERPESSGVSPAAPLLRPVVVVGVALAVVAAVVVACRVFSFHKKWERADWMGDAGSVFGIDYRSALSQQLADFAFMGPQWIYTYTWVLAGIALVALLHSKSRTGPETSLGPEGVDLLLVTAVFAIVVVRAVPFAGSVAAVYGLWLPLNMVALYAVVKAGRRWSVLSRVDRKAETPCVVAELSDPAKHDQLMDDARRCRDLLHRLHLVDHAGAEETGRSSLEEQLHSLHRWRPTGCRHACLPDPVSVVDVALSWGPQPRWWGNALNAARWASLFGILPSVVTAWYQHVHGDKRWEFTVDLPTGIPDAVGSFLTREISFAGAGLVLGALWRVLPGERGPMRALNLFIAWLVPIIVVAALNHSIGLKQLGLATLNVILMLIVLTLTSMWVDTDTFRRERPYWTKRFGLLKSIYQVQGLSGQLAFLITQLAAAAGIWQAIATK